jgi:hypothetical protein
MTTTDYNKQATDFLQFSNTTILVRFKEPGLYFPTDKVVRDIYNVTLKNEKNTFRFTFGQSVNSLDEPTAYDVLSCITKYDCGTFAEFCSEVGYDVDSRSAYKIYKAVMKEWKNIEKMFTPTELEVLRNIQ